MSSWTNTASTSWLQKGNMLILCKTEDEIAQVLVQSIADIELTLVIFQGQNQYRCR